MPRFTLMQMFVATLGICCVLAAYRRGDYLLGFGAGIMYAIVAVLLVLLCVRGFSREPISRLRAGFVVVFAMVVSIVFVYPTMLSSDIDHFVAIEAQKRQVSRNLQEIFRSDEAFAELGFSQEYRKVLCVKIYGELGRLRDRERLRTRVETEFKDLENCLVIYDIRTTERSLPEQLEAIRQTGAYVRLNDENQAIEVNACFSEFGNDDMPLLKDQKHLQDINLNRRPIESSGIDALSGMHDLRELMLGRTNVTDSCLAAIAAHTNLRRLHLHNTEISDESLSKLSALRQLRSLILSDTAVTDLCAATLAQLSNLEELSLENIPISDDGVVLLAELKGIRVLVLNGSALSDDGMVAVAKLPNLEMLFLNDTAITDGGAKELGSLQKLRILYLENTQVGNDSLDLLAQVNSLEQVSLVGTKITGNGVSELRIKRPDVTVVFSQSDEE